MTHPRRIRTAESKRIIERLRRICLALPETTEKEAWAEPTWRVSGKMFAQMSDHHHDDEHCSVWLPSTLEAQEALIAADPKRFFRPAYVGHKGWIGVVLETKPDWEMVAELVRAAYLQIAPPKVAALLDAASPPVPAIRSSARRAASGRAGTRARSARSRRR